jgi:threonine aldolase
MGGIYGTHASLLIKCVSEKLGIKGCRRHLKMTKYSFLDDYSEGCHPDILQALADTNLSQQTAYGDDEYSEEAGRLIQSQLGDHDSSVFFVAGGTLANIIIIASLLRPHEAVISASTGHIATRETGAIEAIGHKIITVDKKDGKLTPDDVLRALSENAHAPHMAKPRLVYISNATETGRIYTKAELEALSQTCRENELIFFLDGARLGAALTSHLNDVSLADLARLTDVFWIGGTKAGALIGEAIVINTPEFAKDFRFHIKQRGALLAKGRVLGIQFQELFGKDLFFTASRSANVLADKLSKAIVAAGYSLDSETETNQIFPILPNTLIEQLEQDFRFYNWQNHGDDHAVLRLVTSWATREEDVDRFIAKL